MIQEIKKEAASPPPRKKPNIILRVLAFVLTLVLAVGAVYLIYNRDRLNFDALKRWYTYRSLAQSDTTGGGEPFPYQSGDSMTFTAFDGDLLAVSETGVRLYSPGGTAYIEETVSLSHPVCQTARKTAVVYDAGGTLLRVYRDRAQVFELKGGATILGARVNDGGCLSVITRSSGYKGVVTLYDPSFSPLLDLNISSAYVLDAVASRDGRSLLVVTAGQQDRLFTCSLARYSISTLDPERDPQPDAVWELGNRLPLDLVWDDAGIRVLTEYAALSADSTLTETGTAEWADRYLKRSSLRCDNAFAVLTGRYRSGSLTTLEVIDMTGEVTASREEDRPILSLSAAGKYISVLTADRLCIYTQDLTLYATIENTQGASHVAQLPDGSAYLAGRDTAWLCLPHS